MSHLHLPQSNGEKCDRNVCMRCVLPCEYWMSGKVILIPECLEELLVQVLSFKKPKSIVYSVSTPKSVREFVKCRFTGDCDDKSSNTYR